MSTLKDMLVPFVGKEIGAQMVMAGQLVGVTGLVEKQGDEIVLVRKRQTIEGQPYATNMGMVTPKKIIPASVTHLGDVSGENVVVIEVQTETMAEAEAAVAKEEEEKKSQVQIASPSAMPGGGPGFVPGAK